MRMHRRGRIARAQTAALTCLLAAVLAGPAAGQEAPAQKISLAGLRLQDLEGRSVELASYLGKGPVILDFWATWCKPCISALPELQQLYADLAPRGLQIVGVNEDGPRNAPKVKPFAKSHGIDFPIVLDLNRAAQSQLQIPALPTTLLLDKDGTVVRTTFGYRPGEIDALRKATEALLDKAPKQ